MIGKYFKYFKYDTKGKIRFWQPEINGNQYRFTSGLLDGKAVTSGWIYAEGKNIGKSNETTPEQQAILEVQSKIQGKLDEGYSTEIETSGAKHFQPMLASDYKGLKKSLQFPVWSQPKLDGIRCIAKADGLWSRSGEKIVSCPHIETYLNEILFVNNPDLILDGELYNHELKNDFNKIASLVRKTKDLSPENLAESKRLVQYHIYDIASIDGNFSNRFSKTESLFDGPLVVVSTQSVNNQEELDYLFAKYLEDGYEGQMIRLNGFYENKRSKFLIKRKEFQDEEFKILDIEEGKGNWAGYAKALVMENSRGSTFNSNIKGNQEHNRKLLEEKELYKGGIATIRYMNLTPDNIPRFPVAIDILKKGENRY